MTNDIRKFINIVEEDPEKLRSAISKRVEKIPDEQDLTDILKFTNKYGIKKDVEKFTTLRNYKGIVSNVFLEALANANLTDAEIKKFLKKLSTDGILDERKLLTPRKLHSYAELIDSEYRKTFDAIKVDIFEKISGKIGEKGDVGKGEYMLDIISPGVNRRGAPGDLDIDGTKIELKAGQNGRLGPAGSQALVGRFSRGYAPIIKQIDPEAEIPTDNSQIAEIFNPKLNMSAFSAFFGNDSKKVKLALKAMLEMHYPSVNVNSMVNKIVGPNGVINGTELKKQMLNTSFDVYKADKDFDGIIIMDSAVTGFLYVNSGDDVAAISDQLGVSFPSWTDTQGNCMKVTLSAGALKAAGQAAGILPTAKSKQSKVRDPSSVAVATHGVTGLKPTRSKPAPAAPTISAPRARR